MSGGVGPSSDISLPNEPPKPRTRKTIFSLTHLNALAITIVLAASGMVSIESISFVICSLIYIYFLSKFSFPILSSQTDTPVFNKNKILPIYVTVGAIIGFFLPIVYIFQGILEGDKEGIKAAAPHVFLLASQVFMEGVASSGGFSIPIKVFVPVAYNSVRIYSIIDWLKSEISKVDEEYGGSLRRVYIGRGLAVANMAFWCFNLFGFLLPYYLPKAFHRYYAGNKKD